MTIGYSRFSEKGGVGGVGDMAWVWGGSTSDDYSRKI